VSELRGSEALVPRAPETVKHGYREIAHAEPTYIPRLRRLGRYWDRVALEVQPNLLGQFRHWKLATYAAASSRCAAAACLPPTRPRTARYCTGPRERKPEYNASPLA